MKLKVFGQGIFDSNNTPADTSLRTAPYSKGRSPESKSRQSKTRTSSDQEAYGVLPQELRDTTQCSHTEYSAIVSSRLSCNNRPPAMHLARILSTHEHNTTSAEDLIFHNSHILQVIHKINDHLRASVPDKVERQYRLRVLPTSNTSRRRKLDLFG
jgi:hypothetical protein